MYGPLYTFLANDHRRLDSLLEQSLTQSNEIKTAAYEKFRAGILKHISMEEKILFPAIQRWRKGEPLPIAAKLRLDHGAIAALLVPTPTPTIIRALRGILAQHDLLEEQAEGVYDVLDQLAGAEAEALLAKLGDAPDVPVAQHVTKPSVLNATRRALARAGYNLSDYEQ